MVVPPVTDTAEHSVRALPCRSRWSCHFVIDVTCASSLAWPEMTCGFEWSRMKISSTAPRQGIKRNAAESVTLGLKFDCEQAGRCSWRKCLYLSPLFTQHAVEMLKQLHFYSSPGLKWDSFCLSMFVYLPQFIFLEYLSYILFYATLCWNMWAWKFWLRCLYRFWNDWTPGCCAQPLLLVGTSEAYNVVRISCCGLQISNFIFFCGWVTLKCEVTVKMLSSVNSVLFCYALPMPEAKMLHQKGCKCIFL